MRILKSYDEYIEPLCRN